MQKRLAIPDFLKGLAVVFMIQVHVMELLVRPEETAGLAGKISLFLGGPLAAPLFMIVMGYFLARRKRSARQLVKRAVVLILTGLALNIGLNMSLFIALYNGQFPWIEPMEYLFGADILFLAGLSIWLIIPLRNLKGALGFVIGALVVLVLHQLLPAQPLMGGWAYLQAFLYGSVEWSYFPLIPWLAYVFAGMAFARLEPHLQAYYKRPPRWLLYLMLAIIVGLIMSWPWAARITQHLPDYYHHGTRFYFWTLLFLSVVGYGIWGLYRATSPNTFLQLTEWLGRNVTMAYVVQWLLIGNVATAWYQSFSLLQGVIWFLAVLLLTLLALWMRDGLRRKQHARIQYKTSKQ